MGIWMLQTKTLAIDQDMNDIEQPVQQESAGAGSQDGLPLVWNLQERVEHYRVPIWDGVIASAADRYRFEVVGPTFDGCPHGGEEGRPYFRNLPLESRKVLGQELTSWPGCFDLIRKQKPSVILVTANPRNTTCWRMAKLCRELGIHLIAWSKISSFSSIPAPILRMVKRRFYPRYDQFVVYGNSARAEAGALGFPDDKIYVAHNTIDTSRIFADGEAIVEQGMRLRSQLGLGVESGKKILLMIARMDGVKRHQDVLDAWPRLHLLDPELNLVMIGGGPMLDQVRSEANKVDSEHIHVLGRVPEGEDYAWLGACDINIQPGAVGLAINQSMAFGIPTICADEPGPDSEIIRHNETGWRYPPGDIDAMVNTVKQVLNDPEETKKIAEAARESMRTEVTIDNMVQAIDAAITSGLAEVSTRR